MYYTAVLLIFSEQGMDLKLTQPILCYGTKSIIMKLRSLLTPHAEIIIF